MIVGSIRQDLNQVAHEGSVKVRKLMQIEEYKSVYQLVSVIEGTIEGVADEGNLPSAIPPSGFDVLARSAPPDQ